MVIPYQYFMNISTLNTQRCIKYKLYNCFYDTVLHKPLTYYSNSMILLWNSIYSSKFEHYYLLVYGWLVFNRKLGSVNEMFAIHKWKKALQAASYSSSVNLQYRIYACTFFFLGFFCLLIYYGCLTVNHWVGYVVC